MLRILKIVVLCFLPATLFAQADSNYTFLATGCIKPNMLATHPLGQFIGRINHNFNVQPVKQTTINVGLSTANIWLPEVKAYLPHSKEATQHLSTFVWHKRDSVFQAMPRNYDSTVFSADGVFRTINVNVRIKTSTYAELEISTKCLWLTGGQAPTALFTSDGFIEDFHSNIKGGEDPFVRKQYTYNQAAIFYQDKEEKKIDLKNGRMLIPNIQANYYLYANNAWLKKYTMQASAGLHLCVNLPQFSRAVDGGVSVVFLKQFATQRRYKYTLAISGGLLRQQILATKSRVDFSSNNLLPSIESMFEFRKTINKMIFWAIGLNFHYTGSFHPASEFSNITPVGNRLSSHWHLALTHMYRNNQYWSLVYSFGGKYVWSVYMLQDFKVNNAPDFQTGISVQLPLVQKCD